MAAVLLVVALVFFLLSTSQWKLPVRTLVWLCGGAALVGAVIFALRFDHNGLFLAGIDLFENRGDPSQSIVAQAFERNARGVSRFVLPLVDLFVVIAALVAVVTLLAFTPGQAIERFVRPVAIGLLGAIASGALALTIVGVGFGSPLRQSQYASTLSARDIHDGDTIWIGEVAVRLFGLDAPELGQPCYRDGEWISDCGVSAASALSGVVGDNIVVCTPEITSTGRQRDALGRVLATCTVNGTDLSAQMRSLGWAAAYMRDDARVTVATARGCLTNPTAWRAARKAEERTLYADLRERGCAAAQLR